MMNVGPLEAAELNLWTYEALLWNWNEAHRSDDDIAGPDPVEAMRVLDFIASDPRRLN